MNQKELLIASRKLNKCVCAIKNNLFDMELLWFRTVYEGAETPNTALHSHSAYELHLCLEAENKYEIDNQIITLKQNEFLLLPPHKKHLVHPYTKGYCELVSAFSFPEPSQISIYLEQASQKFYHARATDAMVFMISDILKHISEEKYGYYEYISSLVSCFFIDLFGIVAKNMIAEQASPALLKENDDRIKIVKGYIKDNIDKKILSSDIAKHINISTRHLNRLVEASEKASVAELIRRARIKHAKKLIMTTQLSLSEIAYLSGYSSSFHFSKAFKALEGITPGAYRKDINK